MSDYIKIQVIQEDSDWCYVETTNLDTGETGFDTWGKTQHGLIEWQSGSMSGSLVKRVGIDQARDYTYHALARSRKYIIIEA